MNSRKLLATCSGGGHLIQLLRLTPAFEDHTLVLATTLPDAPEDITLSRYYCVTDSNAQQKIRLLKTALETARIVLRERPDVVISTGAAPGLLAMAWAWLLRKKLIWIDSISNHDQLSLSGRLARRLTPHCFTQWPHLCEVEDVRYIGSLVPLQMEGTQ